MSLKTEVKLLEKQILGLQYIVNSKKQLLIDQKKELVYHTLKTIAEKYGFDFIEDKIILPKIYGSFYGMTYEKNYIKICFYVKDRPINTSSNANLNDIVLYLSPYIETKYWEHIPKCLSSNGKEILLDMSDEQLVNTLEKLFKRIFDWQQSRLSHPLYKNFKNKSICD